MKTKKKLEIYTDKAIVYIHANPIEIKHPNDDEIVVQMMVDSDATVLSLIEHVDMDNLVACMDDQTLYELTESIKEKFGLIEPEEHKLRELDKVSSF
jgi:hypothetical protein